MKRPHGLIAWIGVFIPKSVIVSVAMEARDDEDIAGQNIQSTNDNVCPSVSSNERTAGKLDPSIHSFIPISTLSRDLFWLIL